MKILVIAKINKKYQKILNILPKVHHIIQPKNILNEQNNANKSLS